MAGNRELFTEANAGWLRRVWLRLANTWPFVHLLRLWALLMATWPFVRLRRFWAWAQPWLARTPWWLVAILLVIGYMAVRVIVDPLYGQIFNFIVKGILTTFYVTLISFVCALIVGLILGLGRVSRSIILRNIAMTYIEFVRGVPILVLIFTISFAIVPALADTFELNPTLVSLPARAIIALVLIYAAYIAEIFRAGIESIGRGQMEAARSLGMTHGQSMRSIILPQAVRNVLPALGNDLIAMLKDSSLVSVLGVREITQLARLSSSQSFHFEETYFILTFLYLTMTLVLSLVLQWAQRKVRKNHG